MTYDPCPCGTGKLFEDCCHPLITGAAKAPSPEALMRSRYSAFARKEMNYIEQTTDPATRSSFDWSANRLWAMQANFTKLEVLWATEDGDHGEVEFKAHFMMNLAPHVHHEFSIFRRKSGVWYYSEGRTP